MKNSTQRLIGTALLILAVKTNSFQGCIIQTNGTCTECYERKVLRNRKGCGPENRPRDHCSLYSLQTDGGFKENYCQICKPGFALMEHSSLGDSLGDFNTICVEGNIQNCLVETVNPDGSHFCTGCSNGLYAVLNAAKTGYTCSTISKPVANCMWGSFADSSRALCLRCNDGFAINRMTQKCEKWSQPGCWINKNATACQACNPYEGFSIDAQGNCFNGTSVDQGVSGMLNKVFGF